MMDITKSREEFEDWVAHQSGHTIEYIKEQRVVATDRYRHECIEIAYQAWIASRESIEVELPAKVLEECEFDRGHNFGIDYCIVSLEESGIRIKGESE